MNPGCGSKAAHAYAVVLIGERRVLFAEACLSEKGHLDDGGWVGKERLWTVEGIGEAAEVGTG